MRERDVVAIQIMSSMMTGHYARYVLDEELKNKILADQERKRELAKYNDSLSNRQARRRRERRDRKI